MPSEAQLRDALLSAHRKGDKRAAQMFANQIKSGGFDQVRTTQELPRQGAGFGSQSTQPVTRLPVQAGMAIPEVADPSIQDVNQRREGQSYLDSLGERQKGSAKMALGGLKQAAAESGLVEASAISGLGMMGAMGGMSMSPNLMTDEIDLLDGSIDASAQEGRDLSMEGMEQIQDNPAGIARPDSVLANPVQAVQYYGDKALESAPQTAAAMAVTAATRSPALGASVFLAPAAGTAYDESRKEGKDVSRSIQDGLAAAAFEFAGEKVPLGAALKFGSSFVGRVLKTTGAEAGGEAFTEAAGIAYDLVRDDEKISFEEFQTRMKDAALTGAAMGGPMAVAGEAIVRPQVKAQEAADKNSEADAQMAEFAAILEEQLTPEPVPPPPPALPPGRPDSDFVVDSGGVATTDTAQDRIAPRRLGLPAPPPVEEMVRAGGEIDQPQRTPLSAESAAEADRQRSKPQPSRPLSALPQAGEARPDGMEQSFDEPALNPKSLSRRFNDANDVRTEDIDVVEMDRQNRRDEIESPRLAEIANMQAAQASIARKKLEKVNQKGPADPGNDDTLAFIAKSGGLDKAIFESEGVDKAEFGNEFRARNNRVVGKPLFRKNDGLDSDGLVEVLRDGGYFPGIENPTVNDALDVLREAIASDGPAFLGPASEKGIELQALINRQSEFEQQAEGFEKPVTSRLATSKELQSAPETAKPIDQKDLAKINAETPDAEAPRGSVVEGFDSPADQSANILQAELKAANYKPPENRSPDIGEATTDLVDGMDEAAVKELAKAFIEDRPQAKIQGKPIKGAQNAVAWADAAAKEEHQAHVAFLDLDNFKAINDNYSHEAGDQAIIAFGEAAAAAAQAAGGRTFHRSGDEFLVTLDDAAQLEKVLVDLRDSLEGATFEAEGNTIPLPKFSFGISTDEGGAETKQTADKEARLKAGLRTERGADRRAEPRDDADDRRAQPKEQEKNEDTELAASPREDAGAEEAGGSAVSKKPAEAQRASEAESADEMTDDALVDFANAAIDKRMAYPKSQYNRETATKSELDMALGDIRKEAFGPERQAEAEKIKRGIKLIEKRAIESKKANSEKPFTLEAVDVENPNIMGIRDEKHVAHLENLYRAVKGDLDKLEFPSFPEVKVETAIDLADQIKGVAGLKRIASQLRRRSTASAGKKSIDIPMSVIREIVEKFPKVKGPWWTASEQSARLESMGIQTTTGLRNAVEQVANRDPYLSKPESKSSKVQDEKSVRAALDKELGSDVVKKLISTGRVKFEKAPPSDGFIPPNSAGAYFPGTDTSVIYTGNLGEGVNPVGVLLHEVGVHQGMRRMLGSQEFDQLLADVQERIDAGDKAFTEAASQVPSDTPSAVYLEEVIAYAVESKAGQKAPLIKRILAKVRNWLRTKFGITKVSVDDLAQLAVGGVKSIANGKPLKDIRLVNNVTVKETGEQATIDMGADIALRRADKRTENLEKLRACV